MWRASSVAPSSYWRLGWHFTFGIAAERSSSEGREPSLQGNVRLHGRQSMTTDRGNRPQTWSPMIWFKQDHRSSIGRSRLRTRTASRGRECKCCVLSLRSCVRIREEPAWFVPAPSSRCIPAPLAVCAEGICSESLTRLAECHLSDQPSDDRQTTKFETTI